MLNNFKAIAMMFSSPNVHTLLRSNKLVPYLALSCLPKPSISVVACITSSPEFLRKVRKRNDRVIWREGPRVQVGDFH